MPKFDWNIFGRAVPVDVANLGMALAAAIGTFLVFKILVALCKRTLATLGEAQLHRAWAEVLRKTLASTSTFALLLTALLVGLAVLALPPPWNERVKHLWFLGLGIQLAIYVHKAVAIASAHYFRSNMEAADETETVAHTLIVWGLQSAIWIVFVLAMLANLGIDISTFIASLGIGGIAIALAVQNILGDLFASLSIAVDKPFEVGDSISVTSFSGTVEHVGLKTTRIRSDSGEQIVIANTELLKSTVRNFKRMSRRRVQFPLLVSPETPPDIAARLPEGIRNIIAGLEHVQFERAHLKTVNQSHLEFDVVYYVVDPSYTLFMDIQQQVLLRSLTLLKRLNISRAQAQSRVLLERAVEEQAQRASTIATPHGFSSNA